MIIRAKNFFYRPRRVLITLIMAALFIFLLSAQQNVMAAQESSLSAGVSSPADVNLQTSGICQTYHVVSYGETLFQIALRYGTTWPILAQVNNIANPNHIYAGQRLCIPYGGQGGIPPVGTVVNCYYLNVRNGPGVGYGVVEIVSRSTQVHILGRNSAATWVQIRTPAGNVGWVNGFYITSYVPIGQLPVVG